MTKRPLTRANHRDHGRPRYQNGCPCEACVNTGQADPCRCEICVEANREYARLRKRMKALPGGKDHPATKPTDRKRRTGQQSVEAQLLLELATIGTAEQMKGLSAAALAMARVMDDATATPQHPAAAGQLRMILKDIRAGAGKGKGRSKLQGIRGGRAGTA